MKNENAVNRTSTVRYPIRVVILILYTISKYYFLLGLGLLVLLVFIGKIQIQNASIPALAMLLYFPLRYLNKRVNGDNKLHNTKRM